MNSEIAQRWAKLLRSRGEGRPQEDAASIEDFTGDDTGELKTPIGVIFRQSDDSEDTDV